MKQKQKYASSTLDELLKKEKEYIKDYTSSKLSMDSSTIQSASNMQNLMRELKIVRRLIAQYPNLNRSASEVIK